MPSTWTSNMGTFNARFDNATQKGLVAAGYVLKNAVKEALRGGYTSGDFVTGTSMNAVTSSDPFQDPGGLWGIRVGTNLLYNLFWEVGHFNLFLRHYVRVEKWRPAALESRNEQLLAFNRVFKRVMGGGV